MNYKEITDNLIPEYPDYKNDIANFSEYIETYWQYGFGYFGKERKNDNRRCY